MRFAFPQSVVSTCTLDDRAMLLELHLEHVETDKRGRWIMEGELPALINVVDTCLLMAADHGAEDASMGSYVTYNAGRWAKREAVKLLGAGQAKRGAYGGIQAVAS